MLQGESEGWRNALPDRPRLEGRLMTVLQDPDSVSLGSGASVASPPRAYRYSVTLVPGAAAVADCLMIGLAAGVSYLAIGDFNPTLFEYNVFCVVFVLFCCLALLSRSGMYDLNAIMRPLRYSDFLILAVLVAFLLFLSVVVALKAIEIFSLGWLALFAVLAIVFLTAGRVLGARLLRRLGRQGVVGRTILVLGSGKQAARFLQRLNTISPFFTKVAGVFSTDAAAGPSEIEGHAVRGGFDALVRHARRHKVDDVVIALPWSEEDIVDETVQALRELPVNVAVSSDLAGFRLAFRPVTGGMADLPVFEVVQRPISGWSSVLKLAEDYVLTGLVVVLLAPLLILTAIAIKLDSPGPVLFRQRRLGFNNRVFWIYKFRSMYHREVLEARTKQATRGDPRITRVGRFIRRTSIDELPQLFNVLEGTMSLVGPRPHAIDHNEDYGRRIRGYFARHKVKPGITGWAQVNGLRGETESLDKMEARVAHDVYYAENWSLLFDMRILVMTAFVVLFQRSAY